MSENMTRPVRPMVRPRSESFRESAVAARHAAKEQATAAIEAITDPDELDQMADSLEAFAAVFPTPPLEVTQAVAAMRARATALREA